MLTDFIRIGHAPEDSLSTKRRKSLSVVCMLVVMSVTLAFFVEADRSPVYRALDVVALATQLAGLIGLHVTRKAENLFYYFAPLYLVVNLGYMLMNGNREGDTLPFLVIPSVAVVIVGPERSRPWFVICFLVMLIVPAIDQYLPDITPAINRTFSNPTGSLFHSPQKRPLEPSEGLAMTAGVLFFYFLIYSGYRQLEAAREVIEAQKTQLEVEYARSENLLENVLPTKIAERLKRRPNAVIADDLAQVTILFADIVDFTPRASRLPASEVVSFLNQVFSEFDVIADKYRLEKIKTIGDAYMVAGGMPEPRPDHAVAVAEMALDMLRVTDRLGREAGEALAVRVGIHAGPAVAGVIGTRKLFYDVWGDTVNTASRLESYGTPGRIQVTQETHDILSDNYAFEYRGVIDVKGKGKIKTYYLTAPLSGSKVDVQSKTDNGR